MPKKPSNYTTVALTKGIKGNEKTDTPRTRTLEGFKKWLSLRNKRPATFSEVAEFFLNLAVEKGGWEVEQPQ